MNEKTQLNITPEEHSKQIEAYIKERPSYETYATVLKRVFEGACAISIPEAFVQSRAKTASSFAEKCVRRFDRYPNAVKQMTDFCGARVIVQTIEQVKAVRQFIEDNFEICEQDDKGLQLSEDKFGYRDMHYIIRLRPDRCAVLGITPEEKDVIGSGRAEVQVRTWLQHAWADTLHDRIYKSTLNIPSELRRTGALLAALMEEGDLNYNMMANELDGMNANYTAFALRKEVEKEIAVQELIMKNERETKKRSGLALKLGRLLAACGEYKKVVSVLDTYNDLQDANSCELLHYLGYALCKVNRFTPESSDYQRGLCYLEKSLSLCSDPHQPFVPNLRKRQSLHAHIHSWLGWVHEQIPGKESLARESKRQAHEHEPANPYYLADMLGYEIYLTHQTDLPAALRTIIREAITTCRNHALAGVELPHAYFTAGRLSLLIDLPMESLWYYARGIQHYLAGEYAFPVDALEEEKIWLKRLHFGTETPVKCRWVEKLLTLTTRIEKVDTTQKTSKKVLIVTGGAVSIDKKTLATIRPLVETALKAFSGTVISGGTVVGVPGLVGEIASTLAVKGEKHFDLIGYIPKHLPHDGPKDDRYDQFVIYGDEKFSPDQILRNWTDLLDQSVNPGDVAILGFGGGSLSALEYRLALAFGASVAVITGVGGAADQLIHDELWSKLLNLIPLPFDKMSVRAFVTWPPMNAFTENALEEMAMALHDIFIANTSERLPDNMKPWSRLKETYKRANREQARYAINILEACGFSVREAESPVIFKDFNDQDVDCMSEMEHGRWNIERLRAEWRYGPRDDARKLHNCLIPWAELSEDIKKYDRNAVINFPSILAKAGLEVYRR